MTSTLDFSFTLTRPPKIVFGRGSIGQAGKLAASFGSRALVVRDRAVWAAPEAWETLRNPLSETMSEIHTVDVDGEPSPELVDEAAARFRNSGVDVVLGIGGGSVTDAGKAIAAMLPIEAQVIEFLEGIGSRPHPGVTLPFIAIPTTAGTGSEASANAVLSRPGQDGFKRSIRHENLVPAVALIDPELALSCPTAVTAACGMDAFTQVLESFVSTNASPITDALAEKALPCIRESLVPAATDGSRSVEVRSGMAFASLISGIGLANAGLGVVHGLAAPIGGYFAIPHGVVCGTLLGAATDITIRALRRIDRAHPALKKYARAGSLITGAHHLSIEEGCEALLATIDDWTARLSMPRLSRYGVSSGDFDKIIAGSGNKNNPARLSSDEMRELLSLRL